MTARKIKIEFTEYNEDRHCPLIIEMMSYKETASISSFCKKVYITPETFNCWRTKNPKFDECYRYGYMLAKDDWEKRGIKITKEEVLAWKNEGEIRGYNKKSRVIVNVDANSNPYEQYKQIMTQARSGDFTSSEIKQIMESINVGTRAYESFELQKEVDAMKDDLAKMGEHRNGQSVTTAKSVAQAH